MYIYINQYIRMKNIAGIFIVVILMFACTSSKKAANSDEIVSTDKTKDTIRIVNEELEYEILIIDIGFNSWLVTQRPITYYSQPTLEIKNNLNVIEWNIRVMNPFRYNSMLYEQTIEYRSGIDYGKEVNYMLYMYFKFFQEKYNQRLSYVHL